MGRLVGVALALSMSFAFIPSARAAGDVTLSLTEYQRLRDAAAERDRVPARAERGGVVIDDVAFVIDLDADPPTFTETFRARVEHAGPISIPVRDGSLDRASVTPDRGVIFYLDEAGITRLVLPGPGTYTGSFRFATRSEGGAEGTRTLTFQVPHLPVQAGVVRSAAADLSVETWDDAVVLKRRDTTVGSVIEVALTPARSVWLAVRSRSLVDKRGDGPLALKSVAHVVSRIVGSDLISDAVIELEPVTGSIERIALRAPPGSEVLYLRGPGLLPWEEQAGVVVAALARAATTNVAVQLRLRSPIERESAITLPVPTLELPGSIEYVSELRAPDGSLIEVVEDGGFARIDANAVPPSLANQVSDVDPVLHARVEAGGAIPQAPVFSVRRLESAEVLLAQVREITGETVVAGDGRALSRIRYTVVSTSKQFLTLTLPETSELWSATSNGRSVQATSPVPGVLSIPLPTGGEGTMDFELLIQSRVDLPDGDGEVVLALPAADVPIASIEWRLTLPAGPVYQLVGKDYQERPPGSSATPARYRSEQRAGSAFAARGWSEMVERVASEGASSINPAFPDATVHLVAFAGQVAEAPPPIRIEVDAKKRKQEWQ